jgi:hypothetical protein
MGRAPLATRSGGEAASLNAGSSEGGECEMSFPWSLSRHHSRRAFVLFAAVALAAAVACGIGATAGGKHVIYPAVVWRGRTDGCRRGCEVVDEGLAEEHGQPDRPQRGRGLPG